MSADNPELTRIADELAETQRALARLAETVGNAHFSTRQDVDRIERALERVTEKLAVNGERLAVVLERLDSTREGVDGAAEDIEMLRSDLTPLRVVPPPAPTDSDTMLVS